MTNTLDELLSWGRSVGKHSSGVLAYNDAPVNNFVVATNQAINAGMGGNASLGVLSDDERVIAPSTPSIKQDRGGPTFLG